MRPRQLTMQAFGPYEKRTTIDFDVLTENSQLFLITGDTGAGKTMIFDAISFALFGSDSGKIRDTQDLRSSFADDRIATEVVLRFEHAGNVYVITRGERRWNQRSDKPLTNPDSYVELKYDDGSVIADKAGNVKDKIAEILGMDQVQFEQVTMIAQGQFRRLLSASSDERKKLLTQLFRTEKFGELIAKIRNEKTDAGEKLDRINTQISTVGGTIKLEPEMNPEEHQELWVYTDQNTLKTAIDSLSELINLEEKTYKDSSCKVEELNRGLEDLQKQAGKLDNLAEFYDDYQLKMKEFPLVKARKEQADREWEKLSKNKTVIEELKNQIGIQASHLDDYNVLDDRTASLSKNQEQQKEYNEEIEKLEKAISTKQNDLDQKEKDQKRIQGAKEEKALLEKELEKMRLEYRDYERLSKEIQKMDNLCHSLNEYKEIQDKASAKAAQSQAEYLSIFKHYHENQAGEMAAKLVEGEACPVCGSYHHPALAKTDPEAPSKEKLNEALNERTRLEEEASKADGIVEKTRDTFKEQKDNVLKEMRDHFGDGEHLAVPKEQWRSVVDTKLKELKTTGIDKKKQSQSFQKDIDNLEKLDQEIPKLRQTIHDQEVEKSNKEQKRSGLASAEIQLQQELKRVQENLKQIGLLHSSRKEAEDEIEKLKTKRDTLQTAFDAAEKEKTEAAKELDKAKEALATYRNQLKDFDPDQQKALARDLEEKQREKDILYEQTNELQNRLTQNKNAKKNLQELSEQFIAAENRFTQLKELDEAASATAAGQGNDGKVAFDIFVLQAYFDQVLNRANQRLRTMSGKRYELFRRKEAKNNRSKTGLDIDVHDCFTGSNRHAETLSGGESFLASMALALGFSDVVQEHAGGVRIESLFIDEGFGTLDEDSLNKAIMVLEDLAGADRMVAVISHVDELKEKLENQLVVEKNQGKSSTVRIVTPTTGI